MKRQLSQKKGVAKRSKPKKIKLMAGAVSGAYYTGRGFLFCLKKGEAKRNNTKNKTKKENAPNEEVKRVK